MKVTVLVKPAFKKFTYDIEDPRLAKLFFEIVKARYSKKKLDILLYPPDDFHRPHGYIFCPWCGGRRRLITDAVMGVDHCQTCVMTTREFYVRSVNHIDTLSTGTRKELMKPRRREGFEDYE